MDVRMFRTKLPYLLIAGKHGLPGVLAPNQPAH
jgi:hypothetical protein